MNPKRWGLVAVLATVLALLMVGPAFAGGPPGDPPGLERAIAAQEAHTDALLARPGVVGTAVGLAANGRAVFLVFTEKAGVAGIPQSLDGVTVVSRVIGKIVAFGDPTEKHQPAPPGVSTGHPSITAGTIGARVTDGNNVYALSNNHVYADENNATIGDHVIQPGTFDGGSSPADDIGTLADFEPIVFSTSASNVMDAAIALSSTSLIDSTTHCGWTPSSATSAAELRMKVKKCGRTTGETSGRVTAINATVDVGYGSGTARFVGQVVVEPGNFSAGGDSGSLIVSKDGNKPVALLFAGSFFATIANPIDPVLARFGVTIDDGAAAPPPPEGPQAPVANAGPDQMVSDGDENGVESVTLDASDSTDSDGTIASYEWDVDGDGIIDMTGVSVTASFSVAGSPHTVALTVTDNDGLSDTDSVAVTVTEASAEPTAVFVMSPSGTDGYATEGGKNGDKHLLITVALVDDLSGGVGGASVSIDLFRDSSLIARGTGTTGTSGTVTFSLKNAQTGTYNTTVTDVTASGLTWDDFTPSNSFPKP